MHAPQSEPRASKRVFRPTYMTGTGVWLSFPLCAAIMIFNIYLRRYIVIVTVRNQQAQRADTLFPKNVAKS
jgi:hypothetical protein